MTRPGDKTEAVLATIAGSMEQRQVAARTSEQDAEASVEKAMEVYHARRQETLREHADSWQVREITKAQNAASGGMASPSAHAPGGVPGAMPQAEGIAGNPVTEQNQQLAHDIPVTEEMIAAALVADLEWDESATRDGYFTTIYRAMTACAPKPLNLVELERMSRPQYRAESWRTLHELLDEIAAERDAALWELGQLRASFTAIGGGGIVAGQSDLPPSPEATDAASPVGKARDTIRNLRDGVIPRQVVKDLGDAVKRAEQDGATRKAFGHD